MAVKTLLVGNEVGSNKVADDGFASAVGKEVKSVGTRSTTTMDNNKARIFSCLDQVPSSVCFCQVIEVDDFSGG